MMTSKTNFKISSSLAALGSLVMLLSFSCKSKMEKNLTGHWGIDTFTVHGEDYRFYTYCAMIIFNGTGSCDLPTYENLHHDCCSWTVVGKNKIRLEGESTPFNGVYDIVSEPNQFIIRNDTLVLSARRIW